MGRLVEVCASRSQEREHLLVDGLQPEHQRHRGARPVANMQELDPLKALEHPAHGRAIGRFVDLTGDPLSSGSQPLTQPMLRQAVDEQAEHHH
jgi:hypothetical protein